MTKKLNHGKPDHVPSSFVNIFAYGSNLHLQRMKARVPSAVPIAIGFVTEYKISFHKRSIDGSAKADAFYTADADDRIWGVVYKIAASEKPVLDRFEFLGTGYELESVEVTVGDQDSITALIYTAMPEAIGQDRHPYTWYLQFVVQGAVQHRLPFCYTCGLLNLPAKTDPDAERRKTNEDILRSATARHSG